MVLSGISKAVVIMVFNRYQQVGNGKMTHFLKGKARNLVVNRAKSSYIRRFVIVSLVIIITVVIELCW